MVIFDVPEIVDSPFCHNKTFPEGLEQRHVHGREKIDMGKRGQDRGTVADNLFLNTENINIRYFNNETVGSRCWTSKITINSNEFLPSTLNISSLPSLFSYDEAL